MRIQISVYFDLSYSYTTNSYSDKTYAIITIQNNPRFNLWCHNFFFQNICYGLCYRHLFVIMKTGYESLLQSPYNTCNCRKKNL